MRADVVGCLRRANNRLIHRNPTKTSSLYKRQIGLLLKPELADPTPDGMFPAALKEGRMAEAKLAPSLPDWMVEHANRYLASGGQLKTEREIPVVVLDPVH